MSIFLGLVQLLICGFSVSASAVNASRWDVNLITNFTVHVTRTQQTVVFACARQELLSTTRALIHWNQRVYAMDISSKYTLQSVLTRKNHGRTLVVVDCGCVHSSQLLQEASAGRYFNKTYQWLLWDTAHYGVNELLPLKLDYVGPNAQLTYVNGSDLLYELWDVHSKGRHLGCPLQLTLLATWQDQRLVLLQDFGYVQSIHHRDEFRGITLRGASVIDQDNVITNAQIEAILSRPTKDSGVAAFGKYHYELLNILRKRFNFTVNFRNTRGWAGRLGNTTFRLGFLGVVKRNEADIGASGAFNRINRFAEFDTIHQSWKFETAFLYRFTPDLEAHSKSGNFLAPFDGQVWFFSVGTLFAVNFVWRLVEWLIEKRRLKQRKQQQLERTLRRLQKQQPDTSITVADHEASLAEVSLQTFAAVCQQGMDPIPQSLPSRTIVLTTFLFSVVMYNYYTSSVVGGLLSSTAQGPSSVAEIVDSPLKLSFEDIGYYKVLFRENKSPLISRLLSRKLQPSRDTDDLPVYSHIEDAIPYLKKGSFSFHCEVVDAFPEIAKQFDANEICDLRVVRGLMETEIMNWVVHKNSQYTEIFRIAMCRVREVGLIERLLRQRQPRQPPCQSLYTVYPVSLSGVISAFMMLAGGMLLGGLVLLLEKLYAKKEFKWRKRYCKF